MLVMVLNYFPSERDILGRLVLAYGELEFELAALIGDVMFERDIDMAIRALFRIKGEGTRIDVADAILRPAMSKAGLEGNWGTTRGALDVCRKIRNQYAHCHWEEQDQKLYFYDLDYEARSATGAMYPEMYHIDLPLLERQQAYFEFTIDWLKFLWSAYYAKTVGKTPTRAIPKQVEAPPLYNPRKSGDSPPPKPEAGKSA